MRVEPVSRLLTLQFLRVNAYLAKFAKSFDCADLAAIDALTL